MYKRQVRLLAVFRLLGQGNADRVGRDVVNKGLSAGKGVVDDQADDVLHSAGNVLCGRGKNGGIGSVIDAEHQLVRVVADTPQRFTGCGTGTGFGDNARTGAAG